MHDDLTALEEGADPAGAECASDDPRGTLFIVGGGPRPGYLTERLVALGGGASARFVVIPAASEAPVEVGEAQRRELLAAGAAHVDVLHINAATADRPEHLEVMARATGIFFSGGDQRVLAAALLGTRLLEAIRAMHGRGGVIGGTSAGAAVMSRVMIIGDAEPVWGAGGWEGLLEMRVPVAEGFGFVDSVIVDQHFIERRREPRLRSVVLTRPDLLGLGIDEATAAIVHPDHSCEVLGESQVVVIEAALVEAESATHSGLHPVRVDLLGTGDRYCLRRRLRLNGPPAPEPLEVVVAA